MFRLPMFVLILIAINMLSGCAFTSGVSTGVLPYKGSTFTITAENLQPAKAKKLAYDEAMEYCSKDKKKFSFIDSKGEGEQSFVLYFECD